MAATILRSLLGYPGPRRWLPCQCAGASEPVIQRKARIGLRPSRGFGTPVASVLCTALPASPGSADGAAHSSSRMPGHVPSGTAIGPPGTQKSTVRAKAAGRAGSKYPPPGVTGDGRQFGSAVPTLDLPPEQPGATPWALFNTPKFFAGRHCGWCPVLGPVRPAAKVRWAALWKHAACR